MVARHKSLSLILVVLVLVGASGVIVFASEGIHRPLWKAAAVPDEDGARESPGSLVDRLVQELANERLQREGGQVKFLPILPLSDSEMNARPRRSVALQKSEDPACPSTVLGADPNVAYVSGRVRQIGRFIEIRPEMISEGKGCPEPLGRILVEILPAG